MRLPLVGRLLDAVQREFFRRELRWRRAQIGDEVHARTGGTVRAGLFRGMTVVREEAWGRDMAAKLLGVYEEELHGPVQELVRGGGGGISPEPHDRIVVVGCAEGYWSVGLALLLPSASVLAFEEDPRARRIASTNARANGVEDRVELAGHCGPAELEKALEGAVRPLCLVDVEGGEADLLQPEAVPGLAYADLVVECHDRGDGSTRRILQERFGSTHGASFHACRSRVPSEHPELAHLSDLDGWLALSEMRSRSAGWLVLRRRR